MAVLEVSRIHPWLGRNDVSVGRTFGKYPLCAFQNSRACLQLIRARSIEAANMLDYLVVDKGLAVHTVQWNT